jgi:hypothetical protein
LDCLNLEFTVFIELAKIAVLEWWRKVTRRSENPPNFVELLDCRVSDCSENPFLNWQTFLQVLKTAI